jgi:hypothetical protein
MGLLFAFFLIGLPLVAGVVDYMMTTGQYKNADIKSKVGGYTPQTSKARAGTSPAAATLQPAPAAPTATSEPPPAI